MDEKNTYGDMSRDKIPKWGGTATGSATPITWEAVREAFLKPAPSADHVHYCENGHEKWCTFWPCSTACVFVQKYPCRECARG